MDEQKAVERFRKQVVDPSQDKLVIVDFWAGWCEPCKALAPLLEKVAAEYADRGVILAKVDVDEEKFIASQFQVQSLPTVYAMFQGQPVADLTPARSESQLKGALDQLLEKLPINAGGAEAQQAADIEQMLAMGEQVLAEGDGDRAASIFLQTSEHAPENVPARSGLIRALIAANLLEDAQERWKDIPQEMADSAELAPVKTALELAANQVDDSELQKLRESASAALQDMEAQLAFAEAAFADGARDEAAETLLKAIAHDASWNEGAAKAKLLQFFEAIGLEDPWVAAQRRKLSILLFG